MAFCRREIKLLLVVVLLVLMVAWNRQPTPKYNSQVALEYLGQRVTASEEPVLFFMLRNEGDAPVTYLSYHQQEPNLEFFHANGLWQQMGCNLGVPDYVALKPGESMLLRVTPLLLHGPWYAEVKYWQGDQSGKVWRYSQKVKGLVATGKTEPTPGRAKSEVVKAGVTHPSVANLLLEAQRQMEELECVFEAELMARSVVL